MHVELICAAQVAQVLDAISARKEAGAGLLDKRRKLTKSENQLVSDLFRSTGTLADRYGQTITEKDIQCLLPGQLINDEVINFQFGLMCERSRLAAGNLTLLVRASMPLLS